MHPSWPAYSKPYLEHDPGRKQPKQLSETELTEAHHGVVHKAAAHEKGPWQNKAVQKHEHKNVCNIAKAGKGMNGKARPAKQDPP